MLLGQFCFSVNDSLVKWTVLKMPGNDNLFIVVFFRGALMCLMISTILAFQGKFRFERIIKLSVLHGRGLIEVGLTFSFLTSILMLPLTDVYTILLTAPLMITASGVIFFKERVGPREWLAVSTGFAGVMIVVWPDEMGWEIGYVLPLFATLMIVIREVYTKPDLDKRAVRLHDVCDVARGVEFAMARARELVDSATARVKELPKSAARDALVDIGDYVLERRW